VGETAPVDAAIADDLEELIRAGTLWDADALNALVGRLEHEATATDDQLLGLLGSSLRSVLMRLRIGPVPATVAAGVEAVVYPRLWKVMEALRDDLPDGELRIRIEVMNRRLARTFVEELG